jgi:hypothetical protein
VLNSLAEGISDSVLLSLGGARNEDSLSNELPEGTEEPEIFIEEHRDGEIII